MNMMEKIYAKARADVKTIALPEGDEPRTVKAAAEVARLGLARPVLLGDAEKIGAAARDAGVALEGVAIVDPAQDPKSADYAEAIRCGATLVRIGSALFGARFYPPPAPSLI